jgi:hypothetical protein
MVFLVQCLRDFAGRAKDLCYVPNYGNAGDALIASGAWQLFPFGLNDSQPTTNDKQNVQLHLLIYRPECAPRYDWYV